MTEKIYQVMVKLFVVACFVSTTMLAFTNHRENGDIAWAYLWLVVLAVASINCYRNLFTEKGHAHSERQKP